LVETFRRAHVLGRLDCASYAAFGRPRRAVVPQREASVQIAARALALCKQGNQVQYAVANKGVTLAVRKNQEMRQSPAYRVVHFPKVLFEFGRRLFPKMLVHKSLPCFLTQMHKNCITLNMSIL